MNVHQILLKVGGVFLLIAINAFFVIAEFAIVSVRKSRIDHLVVNGDIPAQTVQSLQSSLDKLLSTTQLGITLSSLALGWIGEVTIAMFFKAIIAQLPLSENLIESFTHSLAIPLAFFALVYLQIVLGELCPKSLALLYPEKLAIVLAPPVSVITRIFKPFIHILNESTRYLLKLFGVEYTGQGWYKQVTPEELQLIINTEKNSLGLEAEERELLNNVFEFGDVEAVEIMTPRVNIKALHISATYKDLLKEVAETKHARFPVIGDSLDDIHGVIDFKSCASILVDDSLDLDTPLEAFIKPARFFNESILLSELLTIMQNFRLKMVILVDEYGGTSGLVTKQDLISEILGDEIDEQGTNNSLIKLIDEQNFLVAAQINLAELNDLLDFDLPLTDDYQTLGGFLVYHWQKIPQLHETFYFDNLKFMIVDIEGPKINTIKITIDVGNEKQANE